MDELAAELKSDRLVVLAVGHGQHVAMFPVQQGLLASISDRFRDECANRGWGWGSSLSLVADDARAWKVLLHWKLKGLLPQLDNSLHFDRRLIWSLSWNLGQKYSIAPFQDLVMLELLRSLEDAEVSVEDIKFGLAHATMNGTLYNVFAEELVALVYKGRAEWDLLNAYDGIPGMASAMMRAQDSHKTGSRFGKDQRWRYYMTGDGPALHRAMDKAVQRDVAVSETTSLESCELDDQPPRKNPRRGGRKIERYSR